MISAINYYKTLKLFRITQNNKTLVKIIITRTEVKNNTIDSSSSLNYYTNLQFKILESHSRKLKNEEKELISYESCIVNQNYKKIWNIFLEFKTIIALSPISIKNINKIIFLKIIKYEMSEQKKNWLICFETIGIDNKNLPRIFEFRMTIINDNKVQLSYYHIFPSNTDKKMFDFFCIKKKRNNYKN